MPISLRKPVCHRKLLLYGFAGILLFASCGCRSGRDNQIDLLERELRSQEDYIYELEDYVVEYSEKLRESRCTIPNESIVYSGVSSKTTSSPNNHNSNKSKRSFEKSEAVDLDHEESIAADEPSPADDETREEPTSEETEESPQPEKIIPEELEVPDLEIGEPLGRRALTDPFFDVTPAGYDVEVSVRPRQIFIPDPAHFEPAVQIKQATDDEEFAEELIEHSAQAEYEQAEYEQAEYEQTEYEHEEDKTVEEQPPLTDRRAEQLVVSHLFRSGGDLSAPANLLTVVEARDAYDEPVDLNGEMSLMVMTADPNSPQRIHRWDFTNDETAAAWQSSDLGDGLHMELPLEETKLPSVTLELWVRLVTQDGRKLLTQLPFEPRELMSIDGGEAPGDENLLGARPLLAASPSHGDDGDNELDGRPLRLAETEPPANVLRPDSSDSKQEKPRWRASMQRTHALTESFSTTSPATQRWSAQSGSQRHQKPAVAVRPATGAQPTLHTRSNWKRRN